MPVENRDSGASASTYASSDVEETDHESSPPSTPDVENDEDVPPVLTRRAARQLAWAGPDPTRTVSLRTRSGGQAHDILMAAPHKWTFDKERYPHRRSLFGLDGNEPKELIELNETQEMLDQPSVIARHAFTALGADSESFEGLLSSHVSEIEYPPLTYDDIGRSKFKGIRYNDDMR